MIEKIGHYSLESPASIYDEEAMTALQLAGRTAAKVNEVIEQSNKLVTDTTEWMQHTTDETIPAEVSAEVQEQIEDGTFDKQIDKSLGNLNVRVNNLLGSMQEGSTTMDAEVIDLRICPDGEQYTNAGEAMRKQFMVYGETLQGRGKQQPIVIDEWVENSYHSINNGTLYNDPSGVYKRSKYMYPCNEGVLLSCAERTLTTSTYQILCYDKDFVYLGYTYGLNSEGGRASNPGVTLAGTCYISLNVPIEYGVDTVHLNPIDATELEVIEYPFDKAGEQYYKWEQCWFGQNGVCQQTENYVGFVVPLYGTGVKKVFANRNALYNCWFYDGQNKLITNNESGYTDHSFVGREYDVPENAYMMTAIVSYSAYHAGDQSKLSGFFSLIREPEKGSALRGKRILAIGDSITYIDERSGYDNSTAFCGWQRQLKKRGAFVDSLGFSGHPYTRYGDYMTLSLYDDIVAAGVDVTGYDAVILFGGANDSRIGAPVGTVTKDYTNPNVDPTNMVGAIGAIVQYIMENNPDAQIYLCTSLPSAGREYAQYKPYRDSTIEMAKFWHIPTIDLFCLMGVCPVSSHWNDFFYDVTHPNNKGMKRVGNIIANAIEQTIDID